MSGNNIKLSGEKRVANFCIKGIKDLWILKDGNMLSTESESSVCNHPIERVKSRALKNIGRKHFLEAQLVKNGGGTWEFLWRRAGVGKSSEW